MISIGTWVQLAALLCLATLRSATPFAGSSASSLACRNRPSEPPRAAEQQDEADKRRANGALRAPSLMRRLQLILVLCPGSIALPSYTPLAYAAKACSSLRLLCSPDLSGRASTTTSTGPFN